MAEVFIPCLHQLLTILNDKLLYATNFRSVEPAATVQPDRIEPELCDLVIAFDVDVRRLIAVIRVKEEPIRPDP
jgi:hypothetical protein